MMGGLKMRSSNEMLQWLTERRNLGVTNIHASFVGCGAVHDRWLGRRGDFDFLLSTFGIAAELGMNCGATLFVTKSRLPMLEELVAILDSVASKPIYKHYRQFYYYGHGAHRDEERIDEADLDKLPATVADKFRKGFETDWHHAERDWIPILRDREDTPR